MHSGIFIDFQIVSRVSIDRYLSVIRNLLFIIKISRMSRQLKIRFDGGAARHRRRVADGVTEMARDRVTKSPQNMSNHRYQCDSPEPKRDWLSER